VVRRPAPVRKGDRARVIQVRHYHSCEYQG
jgi:hypothetical protein